MAERILFRGGPCDGEELPRDVGVPSDVRSLHAFHSLVRGFRRGGSRVGYEVLRFCCAALHEHPYRVSEVRGEGVDVVIIAVYAWAENLEG